MMDETGRGPSPMPGHMEGLKGKIGPHVIFCCPSQNLPGKEIHDHSQVKPPLQGPDIGDISSPHHIGRGYGKFPYQEIGSCRISVSAVSGYFVSFRNHRMEIQGFHEAANLVAPARVSLGSESLEHSPGTIGFFRMCKDSSCRLFKRPPSPGSFRSLLGMQAVIVSAPAYLKNLAED
jgi:hypothetical protein